MGHDDPVILLSSRSRTSKKIGRSAEPPSDNAPSQDVDPAVGS